MRNKYKNKKTTIDGITFDSKLEARYYEYLKQLKKTKKIKDFECQPVFLLQPAFKKNGKAYRKIEYIADFEITELDGSIRIVDTKGVLTADFKIKEKMFHYHYPDLTLDLVKYVQKFGGWITHAEWKEKKKLEEKTK